MLNEIGKEIKKVEKIFVIVKNLVYKMISYLNSFLICRKRRSIQMKGILNENRSCLLLLMILIIFNLLIGCGGIDTTFHFISATYGENGLIEPEGAIMIREGGSQTFIITPDEGYQIADVLVDGTSVGQVGTYTFENIQLNHTIHASFVVTGSRVYNTTTGVHYDTIQAAINAALDDQTIMVCPWVYLENLVFDNKNITVRSTVPLDPAIVDDTIIDGGGSGSVAQFLNADTSTLEGFTIQNGNAGGNINCGGGIYVKDSSPAIIRNTITGNVAYYGGGIYMLNSSPIITDNTITNNEAVFGGGISVESNSSPTIRDNIITSNTAISTGGGIDVFGSCFPTITDNIITYNTASSIGGGICVSASTDLLPATPRPTGWGTGRENIPTSDPFIPTVILVPAEGEVYTIASNEFLGNEHGDPLDYTIGAHVYFD